MQINNDKLEEYIQAQEELSKMLQFLLLQVSVTADVINKQLPLIMEQQRRVNFLYTEVMPRQGQTH